MTEQMVNALRLDHVAIAATSLEEGRAAVENALGVPLQSGGQHAHYGTHNMLLGLEDGLYLEVIAIDPEASAPPYARWFDLDRFDGPPRLTNWICQTDDLAGVVAEMPQAGISVPLARGDLRWQMAVPTDGILPYDSCFPAVIEWNTRPHPAARLAPSGCRLTELVISHPQADDLASELADAFDDHRVRFEAGSRAMRAVFETPNGQRVLK